MIKSWIEGHTASEIRRGQPRGDWKGQWRLCQEKACFSRKTHIHNPSSFLSPLDTHHVLVKRPNSLGKTSTSNLPSTLQCLWSGAREHKHAMDHTKWQRKAEEPLRWRRKHSSPWVTSVQPSWVCCQQAHAQDPSGSGCFSPRGTWGKQRRIWAKGKSVAAFPSVLLFPHMGEKGFLFIIPSIPGLQLDLSYSFLGSRRNREAETPLDECGTKATSCVPPLGLPTIFTNIEERVSWMCVCVCVWCIRGNSSCDLGHLGTSQSSVLLLLLTPQLPVVLPNPMRARGHLGIKCPYLGPLRGGESESGLTSHFLPSSERGSCLYHPHPLVPALPFVKLKSPDF